MGDNSRTNTKILLTKCFAQARYANAQSRRRKILEVKGEAFAFRYRQLHLDIFARMLHPYWISGDTGKHSALVKGGSWKSVVSGNGQRTTNKSFYLLTDYLGCIFN